MSKIAVLGSGGWGIGIALTAFKAGNSVAMWSCFAEEAELLASTRESKRLLPGIIIPEEIEVTDDLSRLEGADLTVLAVPSYAVRATATLLRGTDCGIIVNAAKGLEKDTGLRLSEVIAEELPESKIVVLSGPTHAEEVARGIPSAIVASSQDIAAAEAVQAALSSEALRVYTNEDVIGAELGGAFKNVIAVAAGIIDGLGCGDNTRAALVTRGLAEITRLGVAMGAKPTTFLGLTGIGDIVVTCTSEHSRNHRYGRLLGLGHEPQEALREVGTVEGYYAAEAAVRAAEKYGIDMPICAECYEIMYNGADCRDTVGILMNRPVKAESDF